MHDQKPGAQPDQLAFKKYNESLYLAAATTPLALNTITTPTRAKMTETPKSAGSTGTYLGARPEAKPPGLTER